VAQAPNLRSALTGDFHGERFVRLEAEERDRLARFCGIAINAGLIERLVVADEKRAAQLADMLRAVLGDPDLRLSVEQQAAFPGVIRRHLESTRPPVGKEVVRGA
jgi:hypothetical protein